MSKIIFALVMIFIFFVFLGFMTYTLTESYITNQCSALCSDINRQYKDHQSTNDFLFQSLEQCWCDEQEGVKVYDREDEDEI